MTENGIIIIVLIVLTFLCYVLTLLFGKEEKSISNALITAGITLVVSCIPEFPEMMLAFTASKEGTFIPDSEGEYWLRSIIGLIVIVLGIVLNIKLKERIYILNMYGIAAQKDIDEVKVIKELHLSEYKIKEQIIDFTSFFDGSSMKRYANSEICQHIEKSTNKFSAKVTDQKGSCFTGMSPIPYTVYAGTFLENAKITRYFEYCNANGGYYYELKKASKKDKKAIPDLKLTFPTTPTSNSTEIVLAISISHEVRQQDLSQFAMDIVTLSLDEPKDNVIRFTQQLDSYKQTIYKCLETDLFSKYPNLKTIHIAASIPSCMSIEIGKSIGVRTNRVQDIVVHHYISSNNPPYSFGLYVSGSKKGQLYH